MNKLFLKIATLTAGVAMAIGVGVGLSSHKEASFTLAATSESVDFTAQGYTNQQAVASYTGSNFTVAFDKGTNSNPPKYYTNGTSIRAYGGNTFTVSSDISIVKISLSFGDSDGSNAITTNVGSFTSPDWTGTSNAIIFTIGGTTGNRRLAGMTVYTETSSPVAPESIVCADQTVIEEASINLTSLVTFAPETTTEKGLSFTVKSGNEHISLNTANGVVTGVSEGDAVVTITPTNTSAGATPIDVNIHVDAKVITSIESSGTKKTDFVEEQALSYGTMKVKVNYNNETSQTLNMDAEGVSVKLGDEVITGARYLSLGDNGKTVTVSYAGFSFQYQIAVSAKEPVQEGYWTKITDAADFVENLEIIIVSSADNYAMGTYSTGSNVPAVAITKDGDGNIDSLVAGVQTYTLKSGDGETNVDSGTFALYDGVGYLTASGGTSNNKLQRQTTISSTYIHSYSFNLTTSSINANFSGRSNMRFNPNSGNPIFNCYANTSAMATAVAYKFVAQSKPADQIAVEDFCKESLYLDSTSPDYIDFNDHTSGTACVAYYSAAKTAYGELTPDQKDIFATSSEFIIARGRDRLSAWAEANKEEFDPTEGTFSPKANNSSYVVKSDDDNANAMMIVAIISSVAITGAAFTFILRKKKLSK